jgi:hypothetical protein
LYVVVPGDLETRTGGYGYDRRIIAGLRDRGWRVDVLGLDSSFPVPTPAAREHATEVLARIPDGSTVLVDGLALGALPVEIERESARLKVLGLVHHPLAEETGIDPALAASLKISESRALAAVRARLVVRGNAPRRSRGHGGPRRDRHGARRCVGSLAASTQLPRTDRGVQRAARCARRAA